MWLKDLWSEVSGTVSPEAAFDYQCGQGTRLPVDSPLARAVQAGHQAMVDRWPASMSCELSDAIVRAAIGEYLRALAEEATAR